MSEYKEYKNRATYIASIWLGESIRTLLDENPNMSVLDVKADCLEFLQEHSSHKIVSSFLCAIADEIDWNFIYNDCKTVKAS